ncbi:hypothetical protein L1280_002694 [Deinococcus sp. HSC-46F16]|uniref:phosphatase PAP2 family protein n=1 Tax=Deinococcus sp. HSC-46F16 TaxID=2910968 RepID=UPI00209E0696|nr:phosphatase PAP2 family protein [Deinococcus sp. HSC-46F16]MCP2015526.1 hypothetical protein [Deinococcus sp. HSC-46F16]
MEAFWLAVTNLGRDEVFIVVLALYTWLVNPWGGRNLGVAFALSYLVNTALKFGFDLPRPFDNGAVASEAARATAGGPGLPSGHTQMSTTLWGGIAAQLGRPGAWVVALILIGLIAFSRLALNVHYPSDVIVGLGLGAAFAALAARGHFAQPGATRWLIPALFLAVAAFLPAGTPREYAVALGLTAGFWFVRPNYQPPRDWTGRATVAVLGLLIVFAVYFGLAAVLGGLSDLPLVRALRYAVLVWVAAEGAPLLLGRWLRRA